MLPRLQALLALLIPWAVLCAAWFLGDNFPWLPALGFALLAALVVCASCRKHPWSVLIWIPLMACTVFGFIRAVVMFASLSAGGASAGPMEGDAKLMVLGLLVFMGISAVIGFFCRPKTFPPTHLVVLGILNLGALVATASFIQRDATRQEFIVHILDSQGQPIPNVAAHYVRSGYGEGGTSVHDASGGPLYSDSNGIVTIPSRQMRYETLMTLTKPGYRDLFLRVEMRFDEYQQERNFSIGTEDLRPFARGKLPVTDSVSMWTYLAPVPDKNVPKSTRFSLRSNKDVGDKLVRYLDIQTGIFSTDTPGDLELELSPAINGVYAHHTLRIIGLKGIGVQAVPARTTLTHPPSSYEHLYQIAPINGYQLETTIEDNGNLKAWIIFLRNHDGSLHGRLQVEWQADLTGKLARYYGTLFTTTSSSREFD